MQYWCACNSLRSVLWNASRTLLAAEELVTPSLIRTALSHYDRRRLREQFARGHRIAEAVAAVCVSHTDAV